MIRGARLITLVPPTQPVESLIADYVESVRRGRVSDAEAHRHLACMCLLAEAAAAEISRLRNAASLGNTG